MSVSSQSLIYTALNDFFMNVSSLQKRSSCLNAKIPQKLLGVDLLCDLVRE